MPTSKKSSAKATAPASAGKGFVKENSTKKCGKLTTYVYVDKWGKEHLMLKLAEGFGKSLSPSLAKLVMANLKDVATFVKQLEKAAK